MTADNRTTLTDEKKREYSRRVLLSRMRVLSSHPFFGMLLMHMAFSIDNRLETAATNGEEIIFCPDFLDKLSDGEVDFILMHETLHVALQHCTRGHTYDPFLFNIACDIVVNSNILRQNDMKKESITLREYGESMHLAPDGKEGFLYTAEEVYNMLIDQAKKNGSQGSGNGSAQGSGNGSSQGDGSSSSQGGGGLGDSWDDHSRWGTSSDELLPDKIVSRISNAQAAVRIMDPSNKRGLMPLCAERFLDELKNPKCDWRTLLAEFIDTEVCDYSFSPPDKRFGESDFYLPDYNDTEEKVENILFMIDTSASMSDNLITECFSEIKGAIDLFGGRLAGKLGFFDAKVVPPVPFDSVEELKAIRIKGGGGTRFDIIFEYVKNHMSDEPPKSIIILTDGYAPFPEEREAMGIDVLWLITGSKEEPTFGRCVYIE